MKLCLLLLLAGFAVAQQDLDRALGEKRYADALAILDQQLEDRPEDIRSLMMRGVVLNFLQRTKDALDTFDRVLQIDSSNVGAARASAVVAYESHSPDAAQRVDRALSLDSGYPVLHAMAGALAFEQHDCQSAIDHFGKATPAIDQSARALAEYGECLLAMNRANEAVAPLQASLQVAPTAAVFNRLAAARAQAGDLQGAISAYRNAIDKDPRDLRNYMDLATLCLDHDSSALALEILDGGIRNNPGAAALFTMRGAVHAQLGSPEKAEADFDRARALEPDQLYGSVGLSLLWRDRGRPEDAIALVRTKLQKSPNDAVLNYLLADSLLKQGVTPGELQFDEARQALERSLQTKPDFAKARAALGKLLLKDNQPLPAIGHLQTAVQIDPTDRIALNQLILALRMAGRREEAEAAALKLRAAIEADRKAEIERNRQHLVRVQ